jgi:Metal-dependent hydrolases of the beta-lactamase superfamily III
LLTRVTFLGTNGWYDNPAGNTICTAIECDDRHVILDAGNGIHKMDRFLADPKPADLFLSHFHLDHIEGLHTIVRLNFSKGLRVFGQPGIREALGTIMRQPYTVPLSDMPFRVGVFELPAEHALAPYLKDARPLVHAAPCLGFRFEIEGRTIAYCTDTGMCSNLIELGRNADLLITECSAISGQRRDSWPHLSPEDAVTIAKETRAKRVALVHFNAALYPTLESRKAVQEKLAREADNILVTFDDMVIEL